mmetsp:Transcript_115169/g.215643  ORF Transcript_115169/g.215643 Transcript_115169/m.215643 type:complete len:441 (+) Transcript_115169:56-1378(+)
MSIAYWVPQPVVGVVPVGVLPQPSSEQHYWPSGHSAWPQFLQIVGVAAAAGVTVGSNSDYASGFAGGVYNGVSGIAQGVAGLVLGGGAAWGGSGSGGSRRARGRHHRRQGSDGPGQSQEWKTGAGEQPAPFAPEGKQEDRAVAETSDDELSEDPEDLIAEDVAHNSFGQQVLAQLSEGDEQSRDAALARLHGSVALLSFDSLGCVAVQRALEVADQKQAQELVSELHGHVLEASRSMYANYVIQKAVETMPIAKISFVIDELEGVAAEVARHRYGCRIICRLLEHSSGEPVAEKLLEALVADARELSRHPYGYHVMRSILEHGRPEHRHRVALGLMNAGDLARLSKNRNASFVVEKALAFCDIEDRRALANAVHRKPGSVAALAKHQFGRHVIRELLKVPGTPSQKTREDLQQAEPLIRSCKHGRRCFTEIQPLLHKNLA